MTDISIRIKELRKHQKLSQSAFGEKIGVSRDVIKNLELNIVPVKEHFIKLICSEFNVNENWLKTGYGEMFNNSPYQKELSELLDSLTPDTQQCLLVMAKELLDTQNKLLGLKQEQN